MRRWIEIFLLVVGLAGVGIWMWSRVRMAVFQHWGNRVLEHQMAVRPGGRSAPRAAPPIPSNALVGRLVIPRLNLRAVVREGAGAQTLDVALGHIPGTSLPGQPGNVGIAGHRDTLLRGLRHIEKNDLIQLQTPAGNYSYQVENTSVVKPDDVAVLQPSRHPELTLVTCYPFYYVGPAPGRFVVKARLLTAESPPLAPPPPSHRVAVRAPKPAVRPAIQPAIEKVSFQMKESESRELAPGILMSLSWTDARRRRANGWLWLAPERRTVWLRDQPINQPILFHSHGNERAELMLTSVARDSVAGYLLRIP